MQKNMGIEVASVVFRGPKSRARAFREMLVGAGPAARMQTGQDSNKLNRTSEQSNEE